MSNDQNSLSCNDDLESTLNFLEFGLNKIVLSDNRRFTLVLGNTGCGKSTFVQWISGDDSKLTAEKVGTGEFVIQDGATISDSVLHSKTLLPDLKVKNGEIFYDCPGFSDTRSASHEIVITYLLKHLCDHMEFVKIILVVDYSSVRFGRNKTDFMNMVSSAVNFIKDIEKFQHSFMLLVSKVENVTEVDDEGRLTLVSDREISENISEYLKTMKIEMQRDVDEQNQRRKLEFYAKALKVIEIMTSRQDKIALFRAPIQKGKLNELKTFRDQKEKIWKMINEKIMFTATKKDDFGYTISDKCTNLIMEMVQKINDDMETSVISIALKIQNDASDLVAGEVRKFQKFSFDCSQNSEATFIEKFNRIRRFIEAACRDDTILNLIGNLPVESFFAGEAALIQNQLRHFDFLQTVCNTKLSSFKWSNVFQKTATSFQTLELNLKYESRETANIVNSKIEEHLKELTCKYTNFFKNKYLNYQKTIENFPRNVELNNPRKIISELTNVEDLVSRITNMAETMNTRNFIESLEIPDGLEDTEFNIDNIITLENNVRYLEIISNSQLSDELLHKQNFRQIYVEVQQLKTQFKETTLEKSLSLSRAINSDIVTKINLLKNFFNQKIAAFDLINLPTTLQGFLEIFHQLSENIDNQNLTIKIRNVEKGLNIADPSKILSSSNLASMISSQEFLMELNQQISFNLTSFLSPFKELYIYLEGYMKWFVFLNTLFLKLSDYSIQENRDSYNVRNLANWGNRNASGIEITQQNYLEFLSILRNFDIETLDSVAHHFQEPDKLIQLNKVLEKTLKSKLQIDRSKPKLVTIKGEYIKFSDFIDENGKLKIVDGKGIEELKIFALTSVFVDQDLKATGDILKLIIITPNFEICGQRRIVLDGNDAEPLDIIDNRQLGSDGRAGNPGGSAGSFYAIVGGMKNEENLTVLLSGGRGGNGEDGVEGKEGRKGEDAEEGVLIFGQKYSKKTYNCHLSPTFHGFKGSDGEKGGDGGKPGLGGLPGSFNVINFSGGQNFAVVMSNGRMGEAGKGGIGGKGGRSGDNKVKVARVTFAPEKSEEFANSGANGKSGIAGAQQNPIAAPKIDPSMSIDQYKMFLIENFNEFHNAILKKFYLSFSENDIEHNCSIFSLLDEFNALTRNFLTDSDEVLNGFDDLSSTIESRLAKSTSNHEIKLLHVLQVAIDSKINLKTSKHHSNLIIDIESYLSSVEREIRIFKNLKLQGSKREIINKMKSNFASNINQKIEDARNLIETKINPFIFAEKEKIDDNIIKLLNEIEDSRNQTENNLNSLKKKRKNLKFQLGLKIVFGGFQTVAQVLSVFGPAFQAAISVCSIIGTGGDSLTDMPENVNSCLEELKSALIEYKNQQQVQVLSAVEEITRILNDFDSSNPNGDHDINESSENEINLSEIEECLRQLRTRADLVMGDSEEKNRVNEELLNIKDRIQRINPSDTKLLNILSKLMKVTGAVSKFYTTITSHQDQISQLDELIDLSKMKLEIIEAQKNNVDQIMTPMLTSMFQDINYVKTSLDDRYQGFFDVAKWNIRNLINDMQFHIFQFTKGFKAEAGVKRCLERVGDAMTTIIQLYDRIEDFQSQKNIAIFIADVTSIDGNEYQIFDQQLANAVQSLEISIKSDLIIRKRNDAVKVFKQWVFPFADVFLSDLENLEPSQDAREQFNLVGFASKAADQVKQLQRKLNSYKSKIKIHDELVCIGSFNSDTFVTKPFYVWKNAGNANEIAQLLSGETVLMYSNALESQEDAIKFNSLELSFKIGNQKIQQNFNELLKRFKVTLTHSGNSFYKCNNKIFLIPSESSQSLHYSFEKDQNNQPIIKNKVIVKIINGDLLLSPYTMWQFKLEQIEGERKISFDELAGFRDQIDLELIGEGSFVRRSERIDLLVDEHYERIMM